MKDSTLTGIAVMCAWVGAAAAFLRGEYGEAWWALMAALWTADLRDLERKLGR